MNRKYKMQFISLKAFHPQISVASKLFHSKNQKALSNCELWILLETIGYVCVCVFFSSKFFSGLFVWFSGIDHGEPIRNEGNRSVFTQNDKMIWMFVIQWENMIKLRIYFEIISPSDASAMMPKYTMAAAPKFRYIIALFNNFQYRKHIEWCALWFPGV